MNNKFLVFSLLFVLLLSACGGNAPDTTQAVQPAVLSYVPQPDDYSDIVIVDEDVAEIQFAAVWYQNYQVCGLQLSQGFKTLTVLKLCDGTVIDISGTTAIVYLTVGSMMLPVPEAVGLSLIGTTISVGSTVGQIVLLAAATSVVTSAAKSSYEDTPCVPQEALAAYMVAAPNQKFRPCDELATESELPKPDPGHHPQNDYDKSESAKKRWDDAESRWGNWGDRNQDWHSRTTDLEKNKWRCFATYLGGKIIRIGITEATRITTTHTFSNVVIFDPMGRRVTSFDDMNEKILTTSPKNLREDPLYSSQVRTQPMNCYDIQSYGITIQTNVTRP